MDRKKVIAAAGILAAVGVAAAVFRIAREGAHAPAPATVQEQQEQPGQGDAAQPAEPGQADAALPQGTGAGGAGQADAHPAPATDYSRLDGGSAGLEEARLGFLLAEEDGDEGAALYDLEKYGDVEPLSGGQEAAISSSSGEILRMLEENGAVAYDLGSPYDNLGDEAIFDVYTASGERLDLVVSFRDGKAHAEVMAP